MSKEVTSKAAAWDEMSDEERISWMAVKVMGWHWGFPKWDQIGSQKMWLNDEELSVSAYEWNPLIDWNHTMQVVEKSEGINMLFEADWKTAREQVCKAVFLSRSK